MKINRLIHWFDSFLTVVYWMLDMSCRILLLGMVVVVSYAVFGRFVLSNTPTWAEELAIFCMVWLSFISSAIAVRDGKHIRMTIISYFLPEKVTTVMHVFSYLMILGIGVLFIFAGMHLYELFTPTILGVLRISGKWMALVIPVSGAAHILMCLARFRREFT